MIQTIKQNKKAVLAFLLALVMVMGFFTFLAPDGLVLTVSALSYGENGMTSFAEGDQILVVNTLNGAPEQSQNRAIYTYTSGQWKQTSGELTWVRDQENTFKAYYPATQDFTLPTDQSSAEKLAAADRMESESNEMFDNQVRLYFEHVCVKLTFNVQYEDFSAVPTLSDIKCGEITGFLNGDKIEFIVEANYMFAKTDILTLKVNGVQQSVKLKVDTNFEKGTHYSYTLTIGQKEAVLTAEQNKHPGGWNESETALGGSDIPGTFDAGKTDWAAGDVIYTVAANAGVDSQLSKLTFGEDGKWTADEQTLHYLSASDTHIRAIYAPNCETEGTEIKAKDDLPFGTGEFLEMECLVENGALKVDFANYTRPYSRLRIVTEPNKQIAVTATMFDPAGYLDSGTYNYTLTADANGNAFLYGTFASGGTVKVVGDVTVEHTFTEATVAENSYVLDAYPLYVDLGLPSGRLWATKNIGANTPWDYGNYFAWGETAPKDSYTWDNYKWGTENNLTKYNATDGKTTLEAADDAATAIMGSNWRMPTYEDWCELASNCTWTWSTINGVNGYTVTGTNGKSIFLPAGGKIDNGGLSSYNTLGYYSTSDIITRDLSRVLIAMFTSDYIYISSDGNVFVDARSVGLSVRAVYVPSN